jgi:hypothetical protein
MVLKERKGKERTKERIPLLHFELRRLNQMLAASVSFILISNSIWVSSKITSKALSLNECRQAGEGKRG